MRWKIGPEVVYLAEGNAADTGTAIKWAQELGESDHWHDACLATIQELCNYDILKSKGRDANHA